MFTQLKKILYFPLASYFRFFAGIRLRRWKPRIVVVTGSNGKTTLLHMLEAQIGGKAKYSHHANSSFGIPFDVLDLHRKSLKKEEWISLILLAPFHALKRSPKEKIYIVEADCDRPGEGKFLAEFLRPEVVLWVSTSRTHGMNFEQLVLSKQFSTVEESIAYEFGFFLEYCSKYAVINGDSSLQQKQLDRTKAKVIAVTKKQLEKYEVKKDGTAFVVDGKSYSFPYLLPEEVFASIVMCREAVTYLQLPFGTSFTKFVLPPGRCSLFAGIKDTTLIDSTYNANLGSIKAMLAMFAKIAEGKKWVVIGDMLELGEEEKEEHEKLGEVLSTMNLDKIILVGPRTGKYSFPKLKDKGNVVSFQVAKEVIAFINEKFTGGEIILFKGSQSLLLEGLIEQLLKNKEDASQLPRRGTFWVRKRKQVGL